jgi:hypothetical protein
LSGHLQSPTATAINRQEDAMAKGQMRSNREKKKPKAEHNKKKKGNAPAASPFAAGQSQAAPGYNPYGKK